MVVSVLNPKGDPGKTILATNLSRTLQAYDDVHEPLPESGEPIPGRGLRYAQYTGQTVGGKALGTTNRVIYVRA